MVPYLEAAHLWSAFHHELVATLASMLDSELPKPYQSHVAIRRYKLADQLTRPTDQENQQEEYIEVREHDQGRVVTLLDVASPLTKTTQNGRNAYLETRRNARQAGANTVDIDLLILGEPTFDFSRAGLPEWDYAVTVNRATNPERHEIYSATLKNRLPKFRLPLGKGDRDVIIDLHAAFLRSYEDGEFDAKIDFLRNPPDEVISARAYRKWKREGRPHGRDKEHWYQAVAELKGEPKGGGG
jgi:hypothetical protein